MRKTLSSPLTWSPTRSSYSVFSLCPVEPNVTLDVSAHDLLNCRAGTTVRIPATITGRPVPKVTWTFDGAAETEKKNELHTLPVDSEVGSTFRQVRTQGWVVVVGEVIWWLTFHLSGASAGSLHRHRLAHRPPREQTEPQRPIHHQRREPCRTQSGQSQSHGAW